MKFPYNRDYNPPAPTVDIRLAAPHSPFVIEPLRALMDTGADASIVPLRHLEPLDITANDLKSLHSQWGETRLVDTYLLDVGIGDLRLPAIEVIGDEVGEEIILGRDVLNKLLVILNGPKQELEISA